VMATPHQETLRRMPRTSAGTSRMEQIIHESYCSFGLPRSWTSNRDMVQALGDVSELPALTILPGHF
jgi:hypothetical protein